MTLEEINNLKAGRETDAIVGLALNLLHKYEPKAKDECAICGGIERHGNHAGYGPCFSEDMNEAMRIVEKMKGFPRKQTRFYLNDGDFAMHWTESCKEWEVGFYYNGYDNCFESSATAPSLPLGICKLALLMTTL